MTGHIFNIQKFCLHDGPGIRTTVFFKGCNLRCAWCANPESQQMDIQLTLDEGKCTACGSCIESCALGARAIHNGKIAADATVCTACGSCVAACPNRAIGKEGRAVSVEEVLAEILKDKAFYDYSGGGVTFSGGEVLLQLPFALHLARILREQKIHVAVETAGAVPSATFAAFLQEVDYVLMDLKHYNSAAHLTGTGVGNEQILENLRQLAQSKTDFLVRIPVIPGFNDALADAAGFAQVLRALGIDKVELLPFHQLGQHKYALLNMAYAYAERKQLHREDLVRYRTILEQHGLKVQV